ncbi:hypothetical protein Ae201684P_017578 [Aphanomyces euteiches]|nr:hypothetical protein Ae201684P_017578 [Aphanomyces euteiches]
MLEQKKLSICFKDKLVTQQQRLLKHYPKSESTKSNVYAFSTQTALPQLSCNIQDHLKEFGDESELVMTESLRHIKRAVDRCNKSNYGSCLITTSMITFVIVAVSWSIVCRLGLLASIGQL